MLSKSLCHVQNHTFGLVPTNRYFHDSNKSDFCSKPPESLYLQASYYPYSFTLDINTTVSTWLDCSRLMSDFCVRSREFIKACFSLKTRRFLPLCVLGNRSKTLLLPIICKHTVLPTASRPRSDGTSLKPHRLNLNSSRDRICTFFRFRMDMDHYVQS